MPTVILVKKGDQVQQKIECRVHKFICTDSLSPIPEGQKRGKVAIVGGNIQSFRTPAKIAEFLAEKLIKDNYFINRGIIYEYIIDRWIGKSY